VYSGDLRDIEGDTIHQKLNALYEKFNIDHPVDFSGHSLSVSDVIVVTEGIGKTPYNVQPAGFEVMPYFFAQKADLIDIKFTGNPKGFNLDGTRIRKSLTAPTRWEAEKMAEEYIACPNRMTVAEAVDGYIALKKNVLSPSTILTVFHTHFCMFRQSEFTRQSVYS